MCDYSLFGIRNRLASEGENLTVHRFRTGSVGLASVSDPATAICIPPGAQLMVQDIPERLQARLGVSCCEKAVFFERSARPYEYRDAIKFGNGADVLLQELADGERVTVLSLGPPELVRDQQTTRTEEFSYVRSLTS